MKKNRVDIITMGCSKNLVDSEHLMRQLQECGYEVTHDSDEPCGEIAVINTCGFIDSAKAEAIDNILQMAQLKEQGLIGKILVTGCLSQRYQQEIIKEMPEVDGILGTGSYTQVVSAIEKLLENKAFFEI